MRGIVRLDTGDELRFTFAALDALERATGKTVAEFLDEIVSGMEKGRFPAMATVGMLARCGLMHARPTITDAEAGDVMVEVGLKTGVEAAVRAICEAYGIDLGHQPEGNPAPAAA